MISPKTSNGHVWCRCKIKFWPSPPIEYRPGVNIQWLLNFDHAVEFSHLHESQFHGKKICRRVKIPRWIVTLAQNSTLNVDLGSKFHVELWPRVRILYWIVTPVPGHNSTFNHDSGSQFNVEFKPWVIFQCGSKTRGQFSTWNLDPCHNSTCTHDPGSHSNMELWPGVTIQRGKMTQDHISTWNYDPGSQFNVEKWPRVKIPSWIMTPGHNYTLNCDPNPGSQFNVESWLGVKIQRGIKTLGHNSTWY